MRIRMNRSDLPPRRNEITADQSVRDIIAAHPSSRPLFDRHGLLGCGGPEGPDEPVGFFARMHDVDPDLLLDELNRAAEQETSGRSRDREVPTAGPTPRTPAADASAAQAPPAADASAAQPTLAADESAHVPAAGAPVADPAARLYRLFITWSLILTLTLGATWGVINLAWIMFALGPVPASHVQAHGQVQVFGFLYLFIIGVAYQVIPRFLSRPLRFPNLAGATFVFLLIGVLARSVGQPVGDMVAGQILLVISAALYLMGIGSFAANVIGTAAGRPRASSMAKVPVSAASFRPAGAPDPASAARRHPQSSRMEPYILAGIFWMVVSTCLAAAQAVVMADRGLTSLSGAWQRPLWFLAIYGGAMSWVFGIGTRVIPGFLATRPARPGLIRAGFLALQAGNVAMAISSILSPAAGHRLVARDLRLFAMLGVASSVLLTCQGLHWLKSVPEQRARGSAPLIFRRFVRAAFYWAAIGATLLIVSAVMEWTSGHEPHSLLQDAVRHVFTVGTFVMIVFGMASRIVPVFEGVPGGSSRLMEWSFILINAGVVLRLAQIGAAYFWPGLTSAAGASGFVALAGIIGMSIVLFGIMKRGRSHERAAR